MANPNRPVDLQELEFFDRVYIAAITGLCGHGHGAEYIAMQAEHVAEHALKIRRERNAQAEPT